MGVGGHKGSVLSPLLLKGNCCTQMNLMIRAESMEELLVMVKIWKLQKKGLLETKILVGFLSVSLGTRTTLFKIYFYPLRKHAHVIYCNFSPL